MSNFYRHGGGPGRPSYYDPQARGMVNPNTGQFTPNIGSGGERQSAFDRAAAGTGTNASPHSSLYQRWQDQAPATAEAPRAIANPPPTDAQAPQQVTQVRAPNPKAAINPRATGNESAAQNQAIIDRNRAIYAPSDRTVTRGGAQPRGYNAWNDPNSDAVQGALDRAAGEPARMGGEPMQGEMQGPTGPRPANPWQRQMNMAGEQAHIYVPASHPGSGGDFATARFASPGEELGPATETATGISRGTPVPGGGVFDQRKARIDLQKSYPEVFQAGTPQNKAFVEHAQRYGEQSAHENAGKILNPTYDTGDTGKAQAQSQITGDFASQNATNSALNYPKKGVWEKIAGALNPSLYGGGTVAPSSPSTETPMPDFSGSQLIGDALSKAANAVSNFVKPSTSSNPAPTADKKSSWLPPLGVGG